MVDLPRDRHGPTSHPYPSARSIVLPAGREVQFPAGPPRPGVPNPATGRTDHRNYWVGPSDVASLHRTGTNKAEPLAFIAREPVPLTAVRPLSVGT